MLRFPQAMATTINPKRPEDAELSRKQIELGELQSRLADLELQLLTLRLEMAEFEKLYYAKVGALYAELDELEAQVAEQQARSQPLNPNAVDAASKARSKADESRRTVDTILSLPAPVERSRALKDLYRAAAKQLHPDLAQDDKDRTIRQRLMTEANLAYEKGDENRLREILDEYNSNPDLVAGNDVGAELVRTIRKISLATSKIKKVETEVHEMNTSELARLRATVNEGKSKGEDVLENLAQNLRKRVQEKRRNLDTV